MRRIVLLAALAGALVAAAAPDASANGRFPASNQIAFSPQTSNLVVLRTTFGLLFSSDGGGSWQWLCEDVLGILSSSTEDPVIGMAESSIVATPGLSNGLVVSRDNGCDWTPNAGPLAGQVVKDLAVRPDAPDTIVALTSTYGLHAGAEGGAGYAQQVFESADDGASFAPVGTPIDPTALATTIEVAAANDDRIYVSAVRSNGQIASLFVSDDHGADWTERPVPIDPTTETAIYIGAVDPASPDLVYVRTQGAASSRLLVSRDAGQTFVVALALQGQMLGFALSEDGSKVYAGDVEQGLFVGARDTLAFQNTSTVRIRCLTTHGADLWACSDETSGFVAGVSADDGATFTAKAHLVAQPMLACPADAGATVQCSGPPRQSFCLALPGCGGDGGADSDGAASSPADPERESSGGCTVSDPGGSGTLFEIASACGALAWAGAAGARSRGRGRTPRRR